MTDKMVVAITGLNANDNPGAGVGIARALRDEYGQSVRIVGLCYEPAEPGIYIRELIDASYLIPFPGAGIADLTERLEQIHIKEGLDIIIPSFDAELYNFIKIAAWLKGKGIGTFLPSHEQLAARDKTKLTELGRNNGFDIPNDQVLYSVAELDSAIERLGFPIVIKGRFYEADVCTTKEAAQKAFYRFSARWALPVIAQQFIKGVEINVAGLGDGKGNAIGIVPMRKLSITEKGKAWAGVTIEDDELLKLAGKFISATQWRGGFELELIRTAEGRLFILEINPRFPAWIYLAAGAGQNLPAALVKMAAGERVDPFDGYMPGKMFIRYSWDELVDLADFQQFSAFGELGQLKVMS